MNTDRTANIAEDLFRHEGARIIAVLTNHLGVNHLQLVEDVVQEALVRALQTWPYRGVPDNPAAWLMQSAKNLALDTLRREQRWNEKQDAIALEQECWLSSPTPSGPSETFTDDTLRMMFICFHPQLSTEAQTALALRTLCGFSPAEIAAAYLTTEAAISKRLVRARQRIRDLALPFAMPESHELPDRLSGVLGTLYLLFNEGYKASGGDKLVREDLCNEAIRLTLLLAEHPATNQPSTHALLALMLLNAARLSGRTDDMGNILRLHEQNRSTWNQSMIQKGIQHLALAASGDYLSEFHLEAGIAACHSTVSDEAATDWPRILMLYDQLVRLNQRDAGPNLNGSPIIALNRSVAIARVHGPKAGLDALAAIPQKQSLEGYHLYHAVRGTFAAELGQFPQAIAAFKQAEALASLPSEREFITQRIRECEAKIS